MSDRYLDLVNSGVGRTLAARLGLPRPTPLRRYAVGQAALTGPALVVGAGDAPLLPGVRAVLRHAGIDVVGPDAGSTCALGAVVLDASAARAVGDLEAARAALVAGLKQLGPWGRVLLLGTPPAQLTAPAEAATQHALEGIVRSVAKELRDGATANLLLVAEGGETALAAPVRFFLSARSAYVDGQVLQVGPGAPEGAGDLDHPLDGKVAVVTGAGRGIGAAIAEVLARDGATVVCVDVPAAGESLAAVANRVGGTALQLDITTPDAGERIAAHVAQRHGQRLDVLVHNAGITRDKLLVNTDAERWASVLAVNLEAQLRINDVLLDATREGALADGGRVISVSSTSGIAGNRGQANYAASKAGVIGLVQALSAQVTGRGITVNAVAPGFIETEMTARMPIGTREVGRRINSLGQGGRPVDVAEAIAFLAHPDNTGVTGQVLRVCGQSMIGA
ncbi:3-oxoacyl-ACP reductase [Oryzihumus leptocrescens]|uniref:3-oxoacyl-[acyl-carrier protein] reductase n=1 Tax=Oryzihumus leptocrescens TaxID=297536 RepID=A0A542ZI95_9MICO|nr:3-oxoacyl-ACP reductase [Oryzihumus leptocrescens]TQL60064.1 3-oxoacyl-[acyl-carrier protein] reductase [Oryzihumus leptocrescens]